MHARRAIVVIVDGLRASALGAYGNTWFATPSLDGLASQSRVVEWMWCDSPDLADFYAAVWGPDCDLPARLGEANVSGSLVTDEPLVARLASASFSEVCRVDCEVDASAAQTPDTSLALLFAAAAERGRAWCEREGESSGGDGRLLWIHARGFHAPWDAPLGLRASLLDADDPPPLTFVDAPGRIATESDDERLLYRAAYAAQAVVLDECLGAFLESFEGAATNSNTLVVLAGSRGYALGDHGAVGSDCLALYSELLHIPCLVRLPQERPAPPPRWNHLARPKDLQRTLAAWFGLAAVVDCDGIDIATCDEAASAAREFLIAAGRDGERAIRTRAWMLRQAPSAAPATAGGVELYVKPDDRWESNEVADRCGDVAERLLAILDGAASRSVGSIDRDLIAR